MSQKDRIRLHQGHLQVRGQITPQECEELAALLDLWHERAGILEFDAGISRAEAEIRAWDEVRGSFEEVAA